MKSHSYSQHATALRTTKWSTLVGGHWFWDERHGIRWQTYWGLVYGWLVENRAPHTNWSKSGPAAVASVGARDR